MMKANTLPYLDLLFSKLDKRKVNINVSWCYLLKKTQIWKIFHVLQYFYDYWRNQSTFFETEIIYILGTLYREIMGFLYIFYTSVYQVSPSVKNIQLDSLLQIQTCLHLYLKYSWWVGGNVSRELRYPRIYLY